MNERKTSKKAGYPVKDPKKPERPGSEPPIMAVYAAPVVKEKK